MKKLTLALLAVAAVAAQAQVKQSWTNTLIDANLTSQTLATAVSPTGLTFTLAFMQDGKGRLVCYDGVGAVKWTLPLVTITSADGAELSVDSAGNPIVMVPSTSNECFLAKYNMSDGSVIWKRQIQSVLRTVEMGLDGQDNIVTLSHGALPAGGYGPVIRKFSTNGNALFTYGSDMASYESTSLAVAANGQIYFGGCKLNAGGALEQMVALTPNGTVRYAKSWTNLGGTFTRPKLAADRNGKIAAVDIKLSHPNTILIRTFDASGTETISEDSNEALIREVRARFDANGRLVVAHLQQSIIGPSVAVAFYDMSDGYPEQMNRATVDAATGFYLGLTDLETDAFGQSYVSAPWHNSMDGKRVGQVFAFDENHDEPVWGFKQAFDPTNQNYFSTAVGRWGVVSLAGTIGINSTYEGVSGIKQLGLRNLLINGQSFTGGRTITGTVNFYSDDTMDRTVALTSSSPAYATVIPSSTVTAGDVQSGLSIELKPTAVRRAIRIEGNFNGITRKVVFYIEPPVVSGLTLFPTTVKGGKNVNATARINGAAPTGGTTVALASSEIVASVPATVSVAEGALTKGFLIGTTVVTQTKAATITATTGSTSKTATLTITP